MPLLRETGPDGIEFFYARCDRCGQEGSRSTVKSDALRGFESSATKPAVFAVGVDSGWGRVPWGQRQGDEEIEGEPTVHFSCPRSPPTIWERIGNG